MKRVFVFDFDGVICDSTDECLVTSWNAWERWHRRSGYRKGLEEFTQNEYDAFRLLRPYVRGAGEYYVLRKCLEENFQICSQSDFEHYCHKWMQHLTSFAIFFFNERRRIRTANLQKWINLHPVWPDVVELLAKLIREGLAYIATLKDRESVRLILEAHNILLPANRLFDESQIASKLEALETIRKIEGCSAQHLFYLDDNATHLLGPLKAGYPCYLTIWGNTPADHLEIAKKNSISCIGLADLFNLVGEGDS